MNEIHRIGDRITVLRDGRRVATLQMTDASDEKLVELMTGRTIEAFFPTIDHHPGEELLAVEGLTAGTLVRDVSLTVCAGEIVGLAADASPNARRRSGLRAAGSSHGGPRGRAERPREHRAPDAAAVAVQRTLPASTPERARDLRAARRTAADHAASHRAGRLLLLGR